MSPLHERATDSVSWGFQVTAAWALRFLIVTAALFVLLTMLNAVSLVTITVIVAVMICALLQPGVELLMRNRVPRIPAAILVFVLGMSALVAAAWFVVQQAPASPSELGAQLLDADPGGCAQRGHAEHEHQDRRRDPGHPVAHQQLDAGLEKRADHDRDDHRDGDQADGVEHGEQHEQGCRHDEEAQRPRRRDLKAPADAVGRAFVQGAHADAHPVFSDTSTYTLLRPPDQDVNARGANLSRR